MAYDPSEWSDLFVATAGASAALAGLVFVAVSINIDRILALDGLPERALETVLMLLNVVLLSIIALIPGQGHVALGAELLGVSFVFGAVVAHLSFRRLPMGSELARWVLSRLMIRGIGTLPLIIGGASVLVEAGSGLY